MRNYSRHIISATNPYRYEGGCEVWLKVWFEEFDGPIEDFCATPFDIETHGKELWIRAMAGEYGPVEIRKQEVIEPWCRSLTSKPIRTLISFDGTSIKP